MGVGWQFICGTDKNKYIGLEKRIITPADKLVEGDRISLTKANDSWTKWNVCDKKIRH
jgi:hypothetical protein